MRTIVALLRDAAMCVNPLAHVCWQIQLFNFSSETGPDSKIPQKS